MKVLLSIKPEFVEKIISGEKRFEYRKAVFKRPEIKSVVIYSTMPEGRIIGEFSIGEIIAKRPEDLWEATKNVSGIDRRFFDEYFVGRDVAYAIQIKDFVQYKEPINPYLKEKGFKAPQSFKYLDNNSSLCFS